MIKKLEQITGETCRRKVLARVNEIDDKYKDRCFNCDNEIEVYCNFYVPVRQAQISIRRGRYAVLTC